MTRADSTFCTVINIIHPHEHHPPLPQQKNIVAVSIIRSIHSTDIISASGALHIIMSLLNQVAYHMACIHFYQEQLDRMSSRGRFIPFVRNLTTNHY
mmetsp:Transcript_53344/g.79725  ORF Transcript_53344/g.79725 Transcript_53344/m.79725 type:complete len:97 (-) Transcript_53344:78-368(-)